MSDEETIFEADWESVAVGFALISALLSGIIIGRSLVDRWYRGHKS